VRTPEDPQPLIAQGIWRGEILTTPRGDGGFGYDPLFLDPTIGRTGAELPLDIKNRISHRGQALRDMMQLIEKLNT
jgi:XTP/dITP diphosphohydrolase